jgi:TolB-like protein
MTGSNGRRSARWGMAVAGIAFAAVAALAQADTRPTLAVMTFSNGAVGTAHTDLDALTIGVPMLLIDALADNTKIRVVERENLQAVIKEQNLGTSGRVDPATAAHLGKILGAGHMIFGGFVTDPNGKIRITARSVNVETSLVEYNTDVEGKQNDLMTLITQLADKLNAGLKLPPLAANVKETSLQQAKKIPLQATLLYSRAIAAKESGKSDEAVQYLQKAIKEFPDFGQAQDALKKLQPTGGTE